MIMPAFRTWALLASIAVCSLQGAQLASLSNEARTLRIELSLEAGRLSYSVTHRDAGGNEALVVEPSALGLTRADSDFREGLTLLKVEPAAIREDSYQLSAGKVSRVALRYAEQRVHLLNKDQQPLTITLRAQADGVAFRYGFPGGRSGELRLTDESTCFKLPSEGKVWLQPYEQIATWGPAYEMEYLNGIPIGTRTPAGAFAGWAMPALFQVKGRWVLLTEAHLDGNCFAAHLQPDCEGGLYRVRLPEENETYGVAPQHAVLQAPWESPWRVFIIGETPATIVESTMVYDLNPPSVIADTSWIKPGLVSWSWWSDMSSAGDYNRLVPWIDLASDLKWPYSTIDLGWHQMRNGNIEQLIAYAKGRKVDLILWYNSGGKHNQVPDAGPMDRLDTPEKCEKEMSWLASLGVKGVKVDFFQSDKQYVINKYLDILKAAARHRILVDFHGATIPRGWARTYPNLMTSEGVRGAEQYWDAGYAERVHTISTIYAFTRNAIGSMDFTPVVIGGAPHLQWHRTTNAFELATAVAFESGWQHICASPAALRVQPDYVLDFLTDLPAAWDETRHLAGAPGDLSVLARRKGATWYISALNGLNEERTVKVPLQFLGTASHEGLLIGDGAWQKETKKTVLTVARTDTLTLTLAGRGGAVVRLRPGAK